MDECEKLCGHCCYNEGNEEIHELRAKVAELEAKVVKAYELGFDDGAEYGEAQDDWLRSLSGSRTPEQVWAALEAKQDG